MVKAIRAFDAFGRTLEDVKVKTSFGGSLTLISFVLIATLTIVEFLDYRRPHLEPSIIVDKSRGERLVVHMNITFPRVPCYLLSVDLMDVSGMHANDVQHDITKSRLDSAGVRIAAPGAKELKGEIERISASREPGYCGSCFGGAPPESGCCNTCDEVRESYVRRGWSFVNPDAIEQCVKEGWTDKIKEQATEGCNVDGMVRVNKVIGNFHLSPGRSFQSNQMHVHDLVPYLQGGKQHDFGHTIHKFYVTAEDEEGYEKESERFKKQVGIFNPLDGLKAHTEESNYMIVSTRFVTLNGRTIKTHQYSVTSYERNLSGNKPASDELGHQTSHGYAGVPGVFVNYEISPMLVVHREERQSFAHFLTSLCAIVGGVLTVAGIIDSLVYAGGKRMAGSGDGEGLGFGSAKGKYM